MSMQPFAHANASSVQEAVEALTETCRPLAGGTDLLALMKEGLSAPEKLVNLKTIPTLGQMRTGRDGWRIGATVTLANIAAHMSMSRVPCLQQAIVQSASPQLRHMATLGGNLAQRPRCWYYRNVLTHCWRKGGQTCYAFRGENRDHAILGGGPCHAVHPSDPAVALLALDALVTVAGPGSARAVPLGELYRLPKGQERSGIALAPNEIITEVAIPAPARESRGAYVKVARRAAWDFALASAAVQVVLADGVVQQARVALGGVATIPWRAQEAEQALLGQPLSAEVIDAAARAATAGAKPLAQNAYKVELLQGVVRQALGQVAAP
jgi:xanthine dehydrogenase YagS FAD-binding subunit